MTFSPPQLSSLQLVSSSSSLNAILAEMLPSPSSIQSAYSLICPYVHRTPLLTSKTLNAIASSPQPRDPSSPNADKPAQPTLRFYFKCENLQRVGAFKVRGAFHALLRLIEDRGVDEVRRRGVITHSSGNHAQALALAASTLSIRAYIVMPAISTPSKIAGTRSHGVDVIFSGSTSDEREAVVADIRRKTDAILVPPYDDYNVICGQGTTALEMDEQYRELRGGHEGEGRGKRLDAVITPIGGGGLNSGVATYFADKDTLVFGAEPSHQGGDDCRRGLKTGQRIPTVKTLTIADGLRTPVGNLNWAVISDPEKVAGVYAVTEDEIKAAMRLVLERMEVVVEPSAVVGLAVCLYNEDFRGRVEKEAGKEGWDVGVVFSGGNTTVEAIRELYA